ncbi:MAG: hypothetical protein AB1432_05660 [Bacteroidota bacterium]
MISKHNEFTTATYPNWFWDVIVKCLKNADEIQIRKFIIESDHSSKLSIPDEDEFEKLFAELKNNFDKK